MFTYINFLKLGVNYLEEHDIMSFLDESGNKVDFEAVAKIYFNENEYFILAPVDEKEDDAFVFRVDMEDGKEVLNMVEDDEEFLNVKREYNKLLYNDK